MPLKNEPPELWHWTQAVVWIGFDIENPDKDDIENWNFGKDLGLDVPTVRSIAIRAISELCEAAQRGDIEPIESGYHGHELFLLLAKPSAKLSPISVLFSLDNRMEIEDQMKEHVHRTVPRLQNVRIAGLCFKRSEILEQWLAIEHPQVTPPPKPMKQRRRNKKYEWPEIFSQFDEMIAEEGAPGPDMGPGWQTKANVHQKILDWYENLYGLDAAPGEEYLAKKLSGKWRDLEKSARQNNQ